MSVHRFKVCVVDDCTETAEVLSHGLCLNNYDAFSVHSGEEALDACKGGNVDLVILDVCLDGIDGYEVCKRLKENPQTKNTVVIFVTAKDKKEDISKGYALGAADFITKPFN